MAHPKLAGRPRIVSLAPSATSILVELGARRDLVGVTKWCPDVAPVGRLPRLGDCWSLDLDAVFSLRPTLVIGSVPYKQETVAKLLERAVTFLAMNPRALADIYADILLLGRLVGRESAARKLMASMKRAFDGIASQARRAGSRPLVYAEAWPNPRISSPPWVAELVEIAGGKMAVPAARRVSEEEVAHAAPEVIVLAWAASGERARPERAFEVAAWKNLPAIRNHRVHVVRDELLNTPGPPLVAGARELLRVLHPELVRTPRHAKPAAAPARSAHGS